MKILALTKYGSMGASSRERFLIYFKQIENLGHEVTWKVMLSDEYLKTKYSLSKPSIKLLLTSYWKQLKNLLQAKHYDLIWLQNEGLPYFPFFIERLTGLYKKKVIVDYDDATFHIYDNHPFFLVRFFLGSKISKVMHASCITVVGNDYLCNYAKKAKARNVVYLPTVVNSLVYKPSSSVTRPSDRVKIGWLGSPTTQFHLSLVKSVLRKLQAEINCELHLMGVDPSYDTANINTFIHSWSEARQLEFLDNLDIGIMPLHENAFSKGKCGYKLIQYMAYSKPVIASPVGVNSEIVKANNGFLASSEDEWYLALKKLCLNEEMRRNMGQEGRRRVEKEFSVNAAFPILLDSFHKCLG